MDRTPAGKETMLTEARSLHRGFRKGEGWLWLPQVSVVMEDERREVCVSVFLAS
ncbi:hypothetical protein BaRGS_00040353, partial [Batillaria attramentaria]